MKTKRITAFFLCIVLLLCSGCGVKGVESAPAGEYIELKDSLGRFVRVPAEIDSIACVCPFTGPMIVMFGFGDKITSTCNNVIRSNLLEAMVPGMSGIPLAKVSGSVNAETILEKNTDVIFVNSGTWEADAEKAKLEGLGIPVVVIKADNIQEQMDAIRIIGASLGADARVEAEAYVSWYQSVIDMVSSVCADIPDEEKPRLYHAVNEAVRTDYVGSICAEWIGYTGVKNVSISGGELSFEGDKAYTTLEQIYQWDPDLIICNEIGVDDYILSDAKWQGLDCVREGRVYQMPVGISRMGHPTSTETPLVLLWLAQLLYPDYFDIDFPAQVHDYYLTYYDFDADSALVDAIISADEMRTAKTGSSVE